MAEGKLLARPRLARAIDGLFFNPRFAPARGPDFGRLTPRTLVATQASIPGWQCEDCRIVLCTYPGRDRP
jgi:hypothetical protein